MPYVFTMRDFIVYLETFIMKKKKISALGEFVTFRKFQPQYLHTKKILLNITTWRTRPWYEGKDYDDVSALLTNYYSQKQTKMPNTNVHALAQYGKHVACFSLCLSSVLVRD